jgi:hypothetical protein
MNSFERCSKIQCGTAELVALVRNDLLGFDCDVLCDRSRCGRLLRGIAIDRVAEINHPGEPSAPLRLDHMRLREHQRD